MDSRDQAKTAIYPGTFDPITKGHVDIIRRAHRLFQNIIIAVSPNPRKTPLFQLAERIDMVREATKDLQGLSIEPFDGLLVDFADNKGAIAIIRGMRAISDFEYEFQMALMNRQLNLNVETLFLMPSKEYVYLSSSLIKEVAGYGGDISDLVPEVVSERLLKKISSRTNEAR